MFSKIVAIEPVSLIPSAEEALHTFANEVVMYPDIPADDEEIVRRIGDADAVLLSYTSSIRREVMERCPNIKYIGMCCSLYSPESANVDIIYANEHGIKVTGIRDYGDEGVVEYVISELVRCFHGFGQPAWEGEVREITGLKAGIIGLGKSGGMIADALRFFGAEISYFARSEKEWAREKGYRFLPLDQLLEQSEAVFCCLNKNTVLLHEAEFGSWVIRRYCSTQGCLQHGTRNRLSNGYRAIIFVFAIPSAPWAALTFGASACTMCTGLDRPHPPSVRPSERKGTGQSFRIQRVKRY